MIRLSLGYPDKAAETDMARLWLRETETLLDGMTPVCAAEDILTARKAVEAVAVSPKITDYVVAITSANRDDAALQLGVSQTPWDAPPSAHVAVPRLHGQTGVRASGRREAGGCADPLAPGAVLGAEPPEALPQRPGDHRADRLVDSLSGGLT